jgi:hypothetical protein
MGYIFLVFRALFLSLVGVARGCALLFPEDFL